MLSGLPNLEIVSPHFDKHCATDPFFADKPQTELELYWAIVLK
jgi:hypothetical protein